jgi:hypothetical protein
MEEKNKNVIERALALLAGRRVRLEALAKPVAVFAGTTSRIRGIWRKLFDIHIDARRAGLLSIEDHWARIRKWLDTPPKTIRYDLNQDRRALARHVANTAAGIRSELARLRAGKRKPKMRRFLPLRRIRFGDGFLQLVAYRPEPVKDSIESLLSVDRLPWPPPDNVKIDALLAEIDVTPKPESEKREYAPWKPIVESTIAGITRADVIRIFGPSNFKRWTLAEYKETWPRVVLTDEEIEETLKDTKGVKP